MSLRSSRCSLVLALVACGDDPARVTLVPVGEGACGKPAGITRLEITAFTDGGELTRAASPDQPLAIDDFPADTRQLAVEVIVGNGVTGAVGKTPRLDFANLPAGELPVAMIPPDGFCATGPMTIARTQPIVAVAGDYVLVVGGTGPGGERLRTGELYDPRTGEFEPLQVPEAASNDAEGLSGFVLAPFPDGRVALTGGYRGVITIFDPASKSFGPVLAIGTPRAFHAALALDDTRQLISGGCLNVANGTCDATPVRSSRIVDLTGAQVVAPNLPPTSTHEGAMLFDSGVDERGVRHFLVAGGFGDAGGGARFALEELDATPVTGLGAQTTSLDGGAVFTAFGRDVDPVSTAVAMVSPDGDVRPLGPAPALPGARLVTLEDGSVLAFGGDAAGRIASYSPTTDTWDFMAPAASGDQPGALDAPTVHRLADGTILVIAATGSWLYRPPLVGPASGSVTVLPDAALRGAALVAPDPGRVSRVGGYTLSSPDDRLTARALVGGPRFARGSIAATVQGIVGGVGLVAQQTQPGRAVIAELVDNQPARLRRIDGTVICTGSVVQLGLAPTTLRLSIATGVQITVDDLRVLACDARLTDEGTWGVAAIGAGAQVTLSAITASRK